MTDRHREFARNIIRRRRDFIVPSVLVRSSETRKQIGSVPFGPVRGNAVRAWRIYRLPLPVFWRSALDIAVRVCFMVHCWARMYLFARAFYPFGYFMIVSVFSPSAAGVFSLSGGSLHSTHEHKSARIRPSRTRAPNAAGSLAVEAPPYRPERQSFRDFYSGFFAKPKNATFFFFFKVRSHFSRKYTCSKR